MHSYFKTLHSNVKRIIERRILLWISFDMTNCLCFNLISSFNSKLSYLLEWKYLKFIKMCFNRMIFIFSGRLNFFIIIYFLWLYQILFDIIEHIIILKKHSLLIKLFFKCISHLHQLSSTCQLTKCYHY